MSYPQFQAASDYLGAIADEDYVKALPSNSYDYYDTMVNEEQVKKECIVYEGIRVRVYCCGH